MSYNIENGYFNNTDTVLYSSIRIYRNINNIRFSKYANKQELHYVETTLQSTLEKESYKYIKCKELERDELLKLKSSLLIGDKNLDNVSVYVFSNKAIIVNLNEHITIQVIESSNNIKQAYNSAKEEDAKLSKYISFAFDEYFGFLTSTPKKIGHSISISISFLLPAILSFHKDMLYTLSKEVKENGFIIKNKSNIIYLRNKQMIGITEKELIRRANKLSNEIIRMEDNLTKRLFKNYTTLVEDRVLRAFAILKSAKILTYKEAIKYITLLYLGIKLKIIDINIETISKIMYMVKEDRIREYYNNTLIKKKDVKEYRAKLVQEIFL